MVRNRSRFINRPRHRLKHLLHNATFAVRQLCDLSGKPHEIGNERVEQRNAARKIRVLNNSPEVRGNEIRAEASTGDMTTLRTAHEETSRQGLDQRIVIAKEAIVVRR